jgi:hypothetical protein
MRSDGRRSERGAERGSALVVAILMLALAGVLATALAELGRRALVRARLDRDGVRASYLAEGGLAEAVAGLPAGWSFTAVLEDQSASLPAAGDPWTFAVGFVDDADDSPRDDTSDRNARVTLRVSAFGPVPVRRRLEAVIGRAPDPLVPGALTLDGNVGGLTPEFLLDGRDFDMSSGCTLVADGAPRAGLALPDRAGLPLLASPEQVRGVGPAPSIVREDAPSFDEVADAEHGDDVAAGSLAAVLGDVAAPAFVRVDGDAVVDAETIGGGTLFVAGRLRVTGRLAYRGLVAAANGITVDPGATLEICGGAYAAGAPAFDVRGTGFVRASRAALRLAATVAPLPAPARVIAVREPS